MINRSYASLALAAFLWGLNLPASRIFMEHDLGPMELSFWRGLSGTILFGLHVAITGKWRAKPSHALHFTLFGVIGVGLYNLSSQTATEDAGAAMAVILLYTAPGWVAILSRFVLGHSLNSRTLIALGISTAGVMLLSLSGGGLAQNASALGIAAGLVSGLCYALHFIYNARWHDHYSTSTLYFYAMLGGTLCLAPMAAPKLSVAQPSLILVVMLVFGATTYLAYLAYGFGLKLVKPVPASVIVNLEPIIGSLLAFILLGERFPLYGLFGGGLVLAGVLVLVTGLSKTAGTQPQP